MRNLLINEEGRKQENSLLLNGPAANEETRQPFESRPKEIDKKLELLDTLNSV